MILTLLLLATRVLALDIEFDRISDQQILFKNSPGATTPPIGGINVGAFELSYIGKIPSPAPQAPVFLFEGLPCKGCHTEKSIYLVSISNKTQGTAPTITPLVYPGKILDPKSGLVFEGRTFFGQCLSGRGPLIVTFQREKLDRKSGLRSSVFVAEPNGQYVSEELMEKKRLPKIGDTLKRVKQKQCKEIEGRNRTLSNKVRGILIRPKLEIDWTEEENADAPKDDNTPDPEMSPPAGSLPTSKNS